MSREPAEPEARRDPAVGSESTHRLSAVTWRVCLEPYRPHPLADLFPAISREQESELAEDIRRNGVLQPIVMFEGKVLDGRHRYLAARLAGVRIPFVEYLGDDPVGFVISANLTRRHLNESQRAMIAADLAHRPRGRPGQNPPIGGIATTEAARLLNTSRRSTERARAVRAHGAPSLVASVEAGLVSVAAAAEVANLPEVIQDALAEDGPSAVRRKASELRKAARSGRRPHHDRASTAEAQPPGRRVAVERTARAEEVLGHCRALVMAIEQGEAALAALCRRDAPTRKRVLSQLTTAGAALRRVLKALRAQSAPRADKNAAAV